MAKGGDVDKLIKSFKGAMVRAWCNGFVVAGGVALMINALLLYPDPWRGVCAVIGGGIALWKGLVFVSSYLALEEL